MKDGVIAKVAAQTEDYYADAMKLMQRENIRHNWEKVSFFAVYPVNFSMNLISQRNEFVFQDWLSIIACKQAGYHAIAEYYQALVHKANKEIGEELARLKVQL